MVFINSQGQTECQNCQRILIGPMGVHDFIYDCPLCRSGPTGIVGPAEEQKPVSRN